MDKPTFTASEVAKRSHWQYDPYAGPDSAHAEATAIAREFIRLFDLGLRKRGCRLMTGVEIEATLGTRKDPDRLKDATKAVRYVARSVRGIVSEPEGGGIEAGNVPNSKSSLIYRTYEDFPAFEVVTRPASPLRTVAIVRGVKKILLEATDEFAAAVPPVTPSRNARRFAKALKPGVVRFGALQGEMFGEHINFSLHQITPQTAKDSDRAFALGPHNMTEALSPLLDNVFSYHVHGDVPLLIGSPESADRLFGLAGTATAHPRRTLAFMNTDKSGHLSKREAARMEMTLPDSSSDIHRTMLLTMAGNFAAVEALTRVQRAERLEKLPTPEMVEEAEILLDSEHPHAGQLPRKGSLAIAQFARESLTLQMMRQVVETDIPPEQQAAYLAKIDRFAAIVMEESKARLCPYAPMVR